MGRDNQPKHRQKARDLHRRAAVRQPYERLLIVCEGGKTEPQYLGEIRQEQRLSTAHVHVQQGGFGTEPLQVVEFAERLFTRGDRAKGVEARAFDQVFVVFDRDQHLTYDNALDKAAALDRRLLNDEHEPVSVRAIASVPCFELWLLIHFEEIHAPLHRNDVCDRLRVYLPGYSKGQSGQWARTQAQLDLAMGRAATRAEMTNARNGAEPYTDMACLVSTLLKLKQSDA
jgi:hypothetical protein